MKSFWQYFFFLLQINENQNPNNDVVVTRSGKFPALVVLAGALTSPGGLRRIPSSGTRSSDSFVQAELGRRTLRSTMSTSSWLLAACAPLQIPRCRTSSWAFVSGLSRCGCLMTAPFRAARTLLCKLTKLVLLVLRLATSPHLTIARRTCFGLRASDHSLGNGTLLRLPIRSSRSLPKQARSLKSALI